MIINQYADELGAIALPLGEVVVVAAPGSPEVRAIVTDGRDRVQIRIDAYYTATPLLMLDKLSPSGRNMIWFTWDPIDGFYKSSTLCKGIQNLFQLFYERDVPVEIDWASGPPPSEYLV